MRTRSALAALLLSSLVGAAPAMGDQSPASASASAPAPAFTADELMSHVRTLAAPGMEGRATGTAGNNRARAFVLEQFRAAGLEPLGKTFELPFTFERRQPADGKTEAVKMQGTNIGGICRGRGAKDNGAMVITAHYDHLGVRDAAIYHGADDNASGVTVLLALARQCRQTPWLHDAIFVAFDAEEMGLQGARAFVATLPIPSDRTIALNINFDMVARGDKNELYLAGTHHTPALKTILQPVASRAAITVLFGHDSGGGQDDWTTQSDHGAFHQAGIAFLYVGVEDHADYHKPTDTADKIDATFFYQSAMTILDAVTAIDRALPLPAK
jgi:Zn-dependent M28 family amino/carboxypeptidase